MSSRNIIPFVNGSQKSDLIAAITAHPLLFGVLAGYGTIVDVVFVSDTPYKAGLGNAWLEIEAYNSGSSGVTFKYSSQLRCFMGSAETDLTGKGHAAYAGYYYIPTLTPGSGVTTTLPFVQIWWDTLIADRNDPDGEFVGEIHVTVQT
jgi:hypothetical protein